MPLKKLKKNRQMPQNGTLLTISHTPIPKLRVRTFAAGCVEK